MGCFPRLFSTVIRGLFVNSVFVYVAPSSLDMTHLCTVYFLEEKKEKNHASNCKNNVSAAHFATLMLGLFLHRNNIIFVQSSFLKNNHYS